jgi:hypothetical protein
VGNGKPVASAFLIFYPARSHSCILPVSLATRRRLLEHGAKGLNKLLVSHMERQKFRIVWKHQRKPKTFSRPPGHHRHDAADLFPYENRRPIS